MSIITLPLNKLIPSPLNVRKTGGMEIHDLAASITAHGLIQNLQVIKAKKDKYEVIAGGRRLQALLSLVESGAIGADYPVPCQLVTKDHAEEISLAENTIRQSMHPADQFEAFRKLDEQGKSPADIAARFGVSELMVKQRLKLAHVSPALMQAYRDDRLSLDQLVAYAITSDHEQQESVFQALGQQAAVWRIRQALTEDKVPADDSRARFIGEEAYVDAGGAIERDLFSDEVYFSDAALLNRLVQDALENHCAALVAEGWKWAEIDLEAKHGISGEYHPIQPQAVELTEAENAELESLKQAYDIQAETLDASGVEDEEAYAKLEELEARIESLANRPGEYLPEDKARAGVIVTLIHGGQLRCHYGLVLPEDLTTEELEASTSPARPKSKSRISAKLLEDLTAHRTAAMQAELLDKPEQAYLALLQTLVCNLLLPSGKQRLLTLTTCPVELGRHSQTIKESSAYQAMVQEHQSWIKRLPADDRDVLNWLDTLGSQERQRLMAYCVARLVNSVETPRISPMVASSPLPLLSRIGHDMRNWWQATAATYLARVGKTQILEAVTEACGKRQANQLAKHKKTVMVDRAETLLANTGWLPVELKPYHAAPDEIQEAA